MKRAAGILASLGAALLLAACSGGGHPHGYGGRALRPVAEPGKVIAVELEFARAARDEGQWKAFADYAAPGAVMFVPQPVLAKSWLKGRANPPRAVTWEPYQVWSSCDGSLAVTKGAWRQPDGTPGYFTTIWERQQDGSYKWLLDSGDTVKKPLDQPEFLQAKVADCKAVDAALAPTLPADDGSLHDLGGRSRDGSLAWTMEVGPDLSRKLEVYFWKDGEMAVALESAVPAPGQ